MKTKTENLFQFLKGFQALKTKPKYDAESYEKVLWFYDIPKQKECFSIIQKIDLEKSNKDSENFNKWIEIKKPKRELCPKAPKEIIPWLKNEKLDNPENLPQLFTSIIKELPT